MIKGAGRNGLGLPLLFIGLSGENVTRIAAGEPARIRPDEMTAMGLPPMEVVVCYGRTEDDIAVMVRRFWPEAQRMTPTVDDGPSTG